MPLPWIKFQMANTHDQLLHVTTPSFVSEKEAAAFVHHLPCNFQFQTPTKNLVISNIEKMELIKELDVKEKKEIEIQLGIKKSVPSCMSISMVCMHRWKPGLYAGGGGFEGIRTNPLFGHLA